MITEYFYTNEQLDYILMHNPQGQIDWIESGFTIKDVVKNQYQGMRNGTLETLLPISDKVKFNLALGNLIAMGVDGNEFYRVITADEAEKIKAELKALSAITETQK